MYLELLISLVIIVGVALLIIWVVDTFMPDVARPARILIGIAVLVALLTKLWPLLSR